MIDTRVHGSLWRNQEDRFAFGILMLVLAAFGVLLWAQGDLFCSSDCPIEMLPRMVSIARSLQSGAIPLWDVNTFAGARPLWMSTGYIYYPLLYPLYLLTNPEDLSQASLLLQWFPYLLHLAWAAAGAYLLARRVLGLTTAGAMVLAMAFTFSPTMLSMGLVNQAQGYSYLPWITFAAVRTLETGSRRTWATGALLVAATSWGTNPDTLNRTLVIVGVQIAALWLFSLRQEGRGLRDVGRLLTLLLMVALGIATYSIGFAGLYTAISLATKGFSLSCEKVATFAEYSSVHPVSLLTLFYPVSLAPHLWELRNLEAGALVLSAASYPVLVRTHLPHPLRPWAVAGATVLGLSILIILGNHTPVFEWLCSAFPLVFGFPHPANFTIGVSWGLAVLAGVGVSAMTNNPPSRAAIALCSWPIAGAALVTILRPDIAAFDWEGRAAIVAGYVVLVALVVLVSAGSPHHLRARLIAVGVLLELTFSPFYLALNPPSQETELWMDHSKWTLAHNPTVELEPILRRIADDDGVRFVGTRSLIDNQAWVVNGRALLGMSPKPIFPSLERAYSSFALNLPYELWLLKLPQFMPNMNVGYLVADREQAYKLLRPPEDLELLFAEFHSTVARFPVVERTAHFDLRALPKPLPYVYVQNRVYVAGVDEQLQRLMETDLRDGAYVSREAGAQASAVVSDVLPAEGVSSTERFDEIQKANPILAFDRSNPNRKVIELEVQEPALLVIAEAWHPGWRGRVDGTEARVWEVNYLQQGIWVERGRHVVELYFRPRELVYGAALSAASLLVIAFVAVRGDRLR